MKVSSSRADLFFPGKAFVSRVIVNRHGREDFDDEKSEIIVKKCYSDDDREENFLRFERKLLIGILRNVYYSGRKLNFSQIVSAFFYLAMRKMNRFPHAQNMFTRNSEVTSYDIAFSLSLKIDECGPGEKQHSDRFHRQFSSHKHIIQGVALLNLNY